MASGDCFWIMSFPGITNNEKNLACQLLGKVPGAGFLRAEAEEDLAVLEEEALVAEEPVGVGKQRTILGGELN